MRKAAALLGALTLIMALTGCGGQKDTLRFVYEKTGVPDQECVSYEVDIGREAGGAAVTAELWEDDECTASTPLTLGRETEELHISLLAEGRGTEKDGLYVQMETGEVSGSILTCFGLPSGWTGYSFSAYKDGDILPVHAGEEIVLAAMPFDTGDGVRSVSCPALTDGTETLEDEACVLVIRAAFTAERIGPQASDEECG